MAEKPKDIPAKPKIPKLWEDKTIAPKETVKAPKRNGVELLHVQEKKQLNHVQWKLKLTRARQRVESDQKDAKEGLKELDKVAAGKLGPDKWPGNLIDSSEKKELETLKESLAKEEWEYQIQFDKTLKAEKENIDKLEDDKTKEEATKKIEKEYIETYSSDMVLSEKPLNSKYLAEKFPSAWKETLLNPESTKNPELLGVRKKMFEKVALDASGISRKPWETDEKYREKLRENFKKSTGVDITQKEFDDLIEKEKDARKTEAETKEQTEGLLPRNENESNEDFEKRKIGETPQEYASRAWWEPIQNIGEKEDGSSIGYNPRTGETVPDGDPKKAAEEIKKTLGENNKYLAEYVDRHALNDPNFSASQPFLMQDLRTAQAYIYYPGKTEITVCSASHGSRGVGNTDWSHGTSLGSKRLASASDWSRNGNSIQIRTDVHGLEACNRSDYSRDIRIHEQHGAATHGCTGLPMSVMRDFDRSVDAHGWGAMEVFLRSPKSNALVAR